MTHINRIDEMTNESLYLRIRPQSKNLFFAVVIGYDKNGNKVSCNDGLRDSVVKFAAIPIKVNSSVNLATELGVYYIAQYCDTYKYAVELTDDWNDEYKYNGTYFE